MRAKFVRVLPIVAALLFAHVAAAQDRAAYLLGNEVHALIGPAPDSALVVQLGSSLRSKGFSVNGGRDAPRSTMLSDIQAFLQTADEAETIVIVLAGHVVNSGSTSWFMAADAIPSGIANVANNGIPISYFLDIAAKYPGGAVVALGLSRGVPKTNRGVSPGLGELDVPQGVAFITGAPRDVVQFLAGSVMEEGAVLLDEARTSPYDVEVRGYTPPGIPFLTRSRPRNGVVTMCSIPDDHISPRRSALFMARWVLTEARDRRATC